MITDNSLLDSTTKFRWRNVLVHIHWRASPRSGAHARHVQTHTYTHSYVNIICEGRGGGEEGYPKRIRGTGEYPSCYWTDFEQISLEAGRGDSRFRSDGVVGGCWKSRGEGEGRRRLKRDLEGVVKGPGGKGASGTEGTGGRAGGTEAETEAESSQALRQIS